MYCMISFILRTYQETAYSNSHLQTISITFILILYFLLYPILPVALTELPVGDIYAFMHFFYHVTYKAFWDNIYPDTVFCVWLNTSGLETNAEANHPIFKSKNSLVPKHMVFSFYLAVNKENNW